MQKSISKAAFTWRLLLSLLVVSSIISCENSNSVGGEIIESGNIRIDTIFVNNFEQKSSNIFSGDVGSPSSGIYEDNLFGTFATTIFLRPQLIFEPTPPLSESSTLKLLLVFEDRPVYGNVNSNSDFLIHKVTERWRGPTLNSDDMVLFDDSEVLGSFTYNNQDSIYVELSDSLLVEYAEYANSSSDSRDSLYNFEFFGIAITPDQAGPASSKLIYPSFAQSSLLAISESGDDTTNIVFDTQGFTLDRNNTPTFNDRLYLSSLLESYYEIDFENALESLTQTNENILKADLVLYEDVAQLGSTIPLNHERIDVNFLDLKFADQSDLLFELQFTASDFTAIRDTTDNSFSFDVTNLVNNYLFGTSTDEPLFLNLNPNGGIIRSTVLYDTTASAELRPKLILKIAE